MSAKDFVWGNPHPEQEPNKYKWVKLPLKGKHMPKKTTRASLKNLVKEELELYSRSSPSLSSVPSEEPNPEIYGDYIKDRPRTRRTLSIRPDEVEEGIYLLQRNLDKLTSDIEENPNFDPGPRQQQLFTMAQDLEGSLRDVTKFRGSASLKSGGLSEEEIERLDNRIQSFKQDVLAFADTLNIQRPLEMADTMDVKKLAEITKKYVQLMEVLKKCQDPK